MNVNLRNNEIWHKDEIETMMDLKSKGVDWNGISKELKRSIGAIKRKYIRSKSKEDDNNQDVITYPSSISGCLKEYNMSAVLNQDEIEKEISNGFLIEGFYEIESMEKQLQPNGFDLTLWSVERLLPSEIYIGEDKLINTKTENIDHEKEVFTLGSGIYKVGFYESINIPADLVGIIFQRSTLMRNGLFITPGVFDAGFRGKGYTLLHVYQNTKIELGTRIAQMVFVRRNKCEHVYEGQYNE